MDRKYVRDLVTGDKIDVGGLRFVVERLIDVVGDGLTPVEFHTDHIFTLTLDRDIDNFQITLTIPSFVSVEMSES